MEPKDFWTTKFEVSGKVQGVFFRKYSEKKAVELGLRGWVQNTSRGTVVGEVQGPGPAYRRMKEWLAKEGSPKSRIEGVIWRDEKRLSTWTYPAFSIRK